MSNAERLIAVLAPIFGEGELAVDEALIERGLIGLRRSRA